MVEGVMSSLALSTTDTSAVQEEKLSTRRMLSLLLRRATMTARVVEGKQAVGMMETRRPNAVSPPAAIYLWEAE